MNQDLAQEITALEEMVREQVPEARFKLEQGEDDRNFWSLYIYTPSGNMQMPANIMGRLDDIWRKHRVTVIAVVYPLALYEEQA